MLNLLRLCIPTRSMPRLLAGLAALCLVASGCAGESESATPELDESVPNGRLVQGAYEVAIDASRSLRIELELTVGGESSVENAEAGEADTTWITTGFVTFENLSPDRAIDSRATDHALQFVIPAETCEVDRIWRSVLRDSGIEQSVTCSEELLELRNPDLDPGERVRVEVGDAITAFGTPDPVESSGPSVVEDRAEQYVAEVVRSPLMAGDFFASDEQLELNPTCRYPLDDGESTIIADYWSETPEVGACTVAEDVKKAEKSLE